MTGQGPRESNERLEFLGDSVLGLVTSEFLYRQHPDEHEGQLTKIKSLLVSKAILSRRALAMGLGRFVLMSHSEVESGGRQRLSILADAFEAVIGAIYLDQGFEASRAFIHRWLLKDTKAIAADERHANYKSHLQEYVQSTYHTHPVYRIRSEFGPDHSKHFVVDVLVGKRALGSGRGRNKKEAEQAAARNALEQVGELSGGSERTAESRAEGAARPAERPPETRLAPVRSEREAAAGGATELEPGEEGEITGRPRRRGRRGGRGRRRREEAPGAEAPARPEAEPGTGAPEPAPMEPHRTPAPAATRRSRLRRLDEELEEVGRPEGTLEERHVDPFDWETELASRAPEAPAEPYEPEAPAPVTGPADDEGGEEPSEARAEAAPEAEAERDEPADMPREDSSPRYGRRTRPRGRR